MEVEGTRTDEALVLESLGATWEPPVLEPCGGGIGPPAAIGDGVQSGLVGLEEALSEIPRDSAGYRLQSTQTIPGPAPHTTTIDIGVSFEPAE